MPTWMPTWIPTWKSAAKILKRCLGLLVSTSAASFGCAANETLQGAEIRPEIRPEIYGRWLLVSVGEQQVPPVANIHFAIDGDSISGFDGCNTFGGSLLEPSLIRQSQMACSQQDFSLPLDLRDPLAHLQRAQLSGDILELPVTPADDIGAQLVMARFRRD